MTIAEFFFLVKQPDLEEIDRILLPVAPSQLFWPATAAKAPPKIPEKAITPKS